MTKRGRLYESIHILFSMQGEKSTFELHVLLYYYLK